MSRRKFSRQNFENPVPEIVLKFAHCKYKYIAEIKLEKSYLFRFYEQNKFEQRPRKNTLC